MRLLAALVAISLTIPLWAQTTSGVEVVASATRPVPIELLFDHASNELVLFVQNQWVEDLVTARNSEGDMLFFGGFVEGMAMVRGRVTADSLGHRIVYLTIPRPDAPLIPYSVRFVADGDGDVTGGGTDMQVRGYRGQHLRHARL